MSYSLVTPPVLEPLTLDEAKLRAAVSWVPGDSREALLLDFIRAAREKVEQDTGLALLTQTRDLYWYGPSTQPLRVVRPLQAVTSITAEGVVFGGGGYSVDLPRGHIVPVVAWPYESLAIRVVVGWTAANLVPPLLRHAVGLLVAHYATIGRDLATMGTIITTTPQGYDDAIAPFRQEILA